MTPEILDFISRHVPSYVGSVLEVGSYNVNGTPRTVLQPLCTTYLGIDLTAGPCVDIVMDADSMLQVFSPEQFDTVVCCECLEHSIHPWMIVEAMKTLLKPGGYLWVSTPTFGFPLHRYPIDCYRFGVDAYTEFIFKDFQIIAIETVIDRCGDPIICCVGRK
jgi:SAM-dependent methyltransferase